jgi:TPR repeat protein
MISPLLAVCFLVAGISCAFARTSAEVAAIFDSGVAAYDAGRYEDAYKIWSQIQSEDLAAMRNMAMMLRKGQGVPKNPQKAREIYEQAAEAGLTNAQADLADMLLRGEAGPPNPKRALPLLEAAAAANHPIAQFELGQFYETGELVPKNLTIARSLYAGAARHGMKQAQERLAMLGPVDPTTPAISSPPAVLAAPPQIVALAAPPPAQTRAPVGETYVLQVGAYKSLADADEGSKDYKDRHATLLSGYSVDVRQADLGGKGIWYRLRIAGIADRDVASALCARLKADGGACWLRR